MADYRLSVEARRDLMDIADYTMDVFGAQQAYDYQNAFIEAFHLLGQYPAMGRTCDDIRQTVRCFREGSHMIYYRQAGDIIYILRILHYSQDPLRHL